MTFDALGRHLIRCETCAGWGKQPSVIVSMKQPCADCGGGGYFTRGTRTRLATLQEWEAATPNQGDPTNGR